MQLSQFFLATFALHTVSLDEDDKECHQNGVGSEQALGSPPWKSRLVVNNPTEEKSKGGKSKKIPNHPYHFKDSSGWFVGVSEGIHFQVFGHSLNEMTVSSDTNYSSFLPFYPPPIKCVAVVAKVKDKRNLSNLCLIVQLNRIRK